MHQNSHATLFATRVAGFVAHVDKLTINRSQTLLYHTRLPVTRWVKLSLNFEFLVPK